MLLFSGKMSEPVRIFWCIRLTSSQIVPSWPLLLIYIFQHSTGHPKCVAHTHKGLANNLLRLTTKRLPVSKKLYTVFMFCIYHLVIIDCCSKLKWLDWSYHKVDWLSQTRFCGRGGWELETHPISDAVITPWRITRRRDKMKIADIYQQHGRQQPHTSRKWFFSILVRNRYQHQQWWSCRQFSACPVAGWTLSECSLCSRHWHKTRGYGVWQTVLWRHRQWKVGRWRIYKSRKSPVTLYFISPLW